MDEDFENTTHPELTDLLKTIYECCVLTSIFYLIFFSTVQPKECYQILTIETIIIANANSMCVISPEVKIHPNFFSNLRIF